VISVKEALPFTSPPERSIEIVICTNGSAIFYDMGTGDTLTLGRGESAVIPAAVARYQIKGNATFYKAGVPI
jgi:mannose-6-phosphate isomerase class I